MPCFLHPPVLLVHCGPADVLCQVQMAWLRASQTAHPAQLSLDNFRLHRLALAHQLGQRHRIVSVPSLPPLQNYHSLTLLRSNAIISLQLLALMATYAVSIGCVALKRLRHQPLPSSQWSLGRLGLPINLFAFVYICFTIIFICFPVTTPVHANSMNWAIVMFTGVLIIALVYYCTHGRQVYEGPVVYVRERQE